MAPQIDRVKHEPRMPEISPPVFSTAPNVTSDVAAVTSGEPVLLSASSDAPDLFGVGAAAAPLVELCLSDSAQTPFRVGVIGPLGAGKTFALTLIRSAIADLGSRNRGAGASRPADVVVATIDALTLSDDRGAFDPATALGGAIFAALEAGRLGANYEALAEEAAHGGADPRRAALAAAERQDELTRRLEAERAAREDAEAKRARLAETLIYETPGSRVDAMIRANRSTIEARLRRFGFGDGDVTRNFRDLLRDAATLGAGSQVALFFRSTWAYRGQLTALLVAVVALLAAAGLDRLKAASASGILSGFGSASTSLSQFVVANESWVNRGVSALIGVAILAVLFNLWRAAGFTALLIRAQRLLTLDIRDRRDELQATVERLDKRIGNLTAEAQAATRRAEALARRAGGAAAPRAPGPAFLQAGHGPAKAARDFLHELGRQLSQPATAELPKPKRVIVTVDNLDTLAPDQAVLFIDAVNALIGPGMAVVFACDPARLSPADPLAVARDRFDVVFNIAALVGDDNAGIAAKLIGEGGGSVATPTAARPIVEPLSASESALFVAMASLIDSGPAAIKRMHNAYRMARATDAPRPLIVYLVAALQSSRRDVRAGVEETLQSRDSRLVEPSGPNELRDAYQVVRGAIGGPIEMSAARAAYAAAKIWTP